jgi:hypothetical protein
VTFTPSHFTAVLLFATFASVVFGITQRSTLAAMVKYGLYCFALFVVAVVGAGWVMWLIRH